MATRRYDETRRLISDKAKTARSQSKAFPRTIGVLDGRPCIKQVYDGTLVARVMHGSLGAIHSQHR